MPRCHGVTRAGKPCSLTDKSTLTNDQGRLIAEPLRRGGEYCALHAKPFCVHPADGLDARNIVAVFIDLETTGTDIGMDRIVELAATHAPADSRMAGGSFSTVVRVDPEILQERGSEAAEVHGISEEEIAEGPNFQEAWGRFLQWLDALLNSRIIESDPETSDEEPPQPQLLDEPPVLLLAAHNGVRFDFPLLLIELVRHNISSSSLEAWLFLDTLTALRGITKHVCWKLQCAASRVMADAGRAHRALDDCLCLRQVIASAGEGIGVSTVPPLLAAFAVQLDLASSLAQISFLMDEAPCVVEHVT
jgi:DNA polymerase III epsilon subunit-like protein